MPKKPIESERPIKKDEPLEPKKKHPGGRPTKYNAQMAKRICDLIKTHAWGLKKLCKFYDDIPEETTINDWRSIHREFSLQYAEAKLKQADLLAEECLEIADDDLLDTKIDPETGYEICNTEYIARSRLRIDTRKWLASKLLPKQYGDKVQHEGNITITHEAALKELE